MTLRVQMGVKTHSTQIAGIGGLAASSSCGGKSTFDYYYYYHSVALLLLIFFFFLGWKTSGDVQNGVLQTQTGGCANGMVGEANVQNGELEEKFEQFSGL